MLGISLFDKCLGGIFVNRVQGYGAATIWKQRAHRWTVSGCRVLPLSIYLFFAYRATKDVSAAVWFRLFKLREWKVIVMNLFTIPYLIYLFFVLGLEKTLLELAILKLAFLVIAFGRNYFINFCCWSHRPDVQVPLRVIALSPLIDMFLSYSAMWGRWKCLLYYIPLVPMRTGLIKKLPAYHAAIQSLENAAGALHSHE